MTPTISIIIPTRNSPETVRRALHSIRMQDYDDYEVMVLDDGSSQATRDAYATWWHEFDARYRVESSPFPDAPGQRQSATRNRGIRLAQGKYLAFIDHDDEWIIKDYLSVAIAALEEVNGDYFFGNMVCTRGEEVAIPDFFYRATCRTRGPKLKTHEKCFKVSRADFTQVLRHHCIHVNTTVIRRELALEINGFVERLHYYEDLDFMLRLADKARQVIYREEIVARYRLPEHGSLTLAQTRLERALQGVYACQHARSECRRPEVAAAARAQESWRLRRDLAHQMMERGNAREALRFMLQGLVVSPTLGGVWDVMKALRCRWLGVG